MANFSPGWNFVAITWLTSARADIVSPRTKYEIACEEFQENQNDTENTNCENRHIASPAVWSVGAQCTTFLDSNSLWDDGTEAKPVFGSARKAYLQRKIRYLQVCRVHGFLDSVVLFNLICSEVDVVILYLSFEIRETTNKILSLSP